ncbi:MAG TPA: TRAP transporter small permease [Burkholderiales bacterium]|nr:TRAP transporter small permease [Burkholderiales bacterium]
MSEADTPIRQNAGNKIHRFVAWLAKVEMSIVVVILILTVCTSIYTIISRNSGHSTEEWVLKGPELALVWMTFLGTAALITWDEHVTADFVLTRLPPMARRVVEVIFWLATLAVAIYVLAGSINVVEQGAAGGQKIYEFFNLPIQYGQGILPVGSALWIVHILAKLAEIVCGATPMPRDNSAKAEAD